MEEDEFQKRKQEVRDLLKIFQVKNITDEQIEEALITKEEESRKIDLDKIEQEVNSLLGMLQDRHPGIPTWKIALFDKMETVQKLTAEAIGK